MKPLTVIIIVTDFGPLGASVDVIGMGHNNDALLDENEEPYAIGLIYQKEIAYYTKLSYP